MSSAFPHDSPYPPTLGCLEGPRGSRGPGPRGQWSLVLGPRRLGPRGPLNGPLVLGPRGLRIWAGGAMVHWSWAQGPGPNERAPMQVLGAWAQGAGPKIPRAWARGAGLEGPKVLGHHKRAPKSAGSLFPSGASGPVAQGASEYSGEFALGPKGPSNPAGNRPWGPRRLLGPWRLLLDTVLPIQLRQHCNGQHCSGLQRTGSTGP